MVKDINDKELTTEHIELEVTDIHTDCIYNLNMALGNHNIINIEFCYYNHSSVGQSPFLTFSVVCLENTFFTPVGFQISQVLFEHKIVHLATDQAIGSLSSKGKEKIRETLGKEFYLTLLQS
ncbi:hypothetical protein [Parabacteroides sp. PF5-9]|uniref:hypothetical protein n=1 Tax=Parabacteroides sp. PF5-9 TaxID=1742404 RepID=UPI002476EC7A|nr:hypothetical protein [Parabacteroides sp. PF5-9]MDH6358915.1 hypothetical protein [Parabacteroides sp. PF5-9]